MVALFSGNRWKIVCEYKRLFTLLGVLLLVCIWQNTYAQMPPPGMRLDNRGRPMGPAQRGNDSLKQRDSNEDSITIFYRMFDSSRTRLIDSSTSNFYARFPLPLSYLYLNQYGAATRPILFTPNTAPGYDPGFHAYDAYHFSVKDTRFYNTTRPYTELDYVLGGRAEQTIKLVHTQNITPLWNVSFDYRLINSPGHFKNSTTNHSGIKFTTAFSTKNRRYSGLAIMLRNRTKANENGGVRNDTFLTSRNPAFFERFNIPTWLGFDEAFTNNFFTSNLATGFDHYNQTIYFRHQYDIGQKEESYDEDSSIIQKFYPRIRFQHNLQVVNRGFTYKDENVKTASSQEAYLKHFNLSNTDSIGRMTDRWREITNEAAILLFPEKNNQEQYLKLGGAFQWLKGWFAGLPKGFNGTYLFGEYRNRTRNKKWDINANGKIFTTGAYAGNYLVAANLQTNLGSKIGALLLGFENANRTPGFLFNPESNFVLRQAIDLNEENWTTLSADLYVTKLKLKLSGRYFLVSNFTYWNEFTTAVQDATLQNIIRIGGDKKFVLTRRWNLYSEVYFQKSSSSGINLPLFFTTNRLAYEGNFYKKLNLSTGVEFRYFSPFTADNYTPFNGQWVAQNDQSFANRPDLAAFLHIRIMGFKGFIRAENLNTFSFKNGFSWTNNTMAAPLYANPGFLLRVGIFWSFVN